MAAVSGGERVGGCIFCVPLLVRKLKTVLLNWTRALVGDGWPFLFLFCSLRNESLMNLELDKIDYFFKIESLRYSESC